MNSEKRFVTRLKEILADCNLDNYSYIGRQLGFSRQVIWNYTEGIRMPKAVDRKRIVDLINKLAYTAYTELDIWPSFISNKGINRE